MSRTHPRPDAVVIPAEAGARRRIMIRSGVLAVLIWLTLEQLGVPAVIGVSFVRSLPVILVGGALLGLTRAAMLLDWIAGTAIAVMFVAAFTPILRPAVASLQDADPIPASGASAVVVLSSAVSADSVLSPAGADRLLFGIELMHRGIAPVLVTSRVQHPHPEGPITSDADQRRLIDLAPDSVRWLVLDSVATTRDEAVRAVALAEREGWRDLIVVTSPLHTRRACAAFRKAGATVHCAAAPSREVAVRTMATAGERLKAFGPWLYETIGWWWYRAKGWV